MSSQPIQPTQFTQTQIDLSSLQQSILQDQIIPNYKKEIFDALQGRNIWNKISVVLTITTFIMMAGSSITSFSSPQFNCRFLPLNINL